MFGLGITELIIILVIILIMFGAGKIPEIAEGLGKGISNFRKSVKAPDEIDVTPQDKKGDQGDREGASSQRLPSNEHDVGGS